ncbi:DciA family protein [Aromatoleum toluclasticum]|uniref:DciA family protein n=1 Tax=Aromatoleum toluclasticum TaxID=92003 RepID=UPI000382CE6E|nr:DciA family protein [Aromatoleum toluclasticum]MCC4117898.1 DciA family protein [Aromatoleum toluclasticum]
MTQLIQRFLGTGDALARLKDHAARLVRLQNLLQQHLPPALASACSVANLKGDTLVLLANGGAAAARLKQIAPSLIQQFGAVGLPIKTVQVKVKVLETHEERRPPPQRTISEDGSRSIADFSATLPADSPLRESLERLVRRSRRD